MTRTIAPEFQKLTNAEIEAALLDSTGKNPVIRELARLLNAYADDCARLARKGIDPNILLQRPPNCALDALAQEITAGLRPAKNDG